MGRKFKTGTDGEPVASTDGHNWTTEDEKAWLLSIGDTARGVKCLRGEGARAQPTQDQATMLRSYLATAVWRVNWGAVNPREAVAYARQLLERIEERAGSIWQPI